MKLHLTRITCAVILSVGVADAAFATSDFTGIYDVSQWTTTDTASGTVNVSGAPTTISLTSGNASVDGSTIAGNTDFTITVPVASQIAFNWSYNTSDGAPEFDPFGYLVNGVFTTVVSVGDLTPVLQQSGHVTLTVAGGDVFGFRANTFDGFNGAAVTSISNFDATPVPIPAGIWLFGSAALALAPWAQRKKKVESV
jgi:hypothetical protein